MLDREIDRETDRDRQRDRETDRQTHYMIGLKTGSVLSGTMWSPKVDGEPRAADSPITAAGGLIGDLESSSTLVIGSQTIELSARLGWLGTERRESAKADRRPPNSTAIIDRS